VAQQSWDAYELQTKVVFQNVVAPLLANGLDGEEAHARRIVGFQEKTR